MLLRDVVNAKSKVWKDIDSMLHFMYERRRNKNVCLSIYLSDYFCKRKHRKDKVEKMKLVICSVGMGLEELGKGVIPP